VTDGTVWTSADVAAATGGRAVGRWATTGVSIDSRAIDPGDLFVALQGERSDGNAYAGDALRRGAAAAMVSRADALPKTAPGIVVYDTQRALEDLGRAGRARSSAKVVAVTGSVGKTGTKEMLGLALGALGPTAYSVRSFNNHIGVPLTLARLPKDCAFAVCEIGMNHPGEIDALTRQVRPHVAIITTVEPAHLAFFPSVEAIADAKAEIFHGMAGGTAILNRDNAHFDRLAAAARASGVSRIIAFGADERADVRLTSYETEAGRSLVEATVAGKAVAYALGVEGRHWAMNSLAALAAVDALGGSVEAASRALVKMTAPKGRGARHRLDWTDGTLLLIDDSYNASPAAMRAAFTVLGAAEVGEGGRRIAALGDMRELGATSADLHAGLAEAIIAAGIDLVFTVGPEMENLHAALPAERRGSHAETAEALAPVLVESLRAGDAVLVKGSLTTRMGAVVEALQKAGRKEPCRHAL